MGARAFSLLLMLLFATSLASSANAQILFQDDFEDGSFDVGPTHPQPVWYWPDCSATNGPNAWWKITSADKHSGNYAIRLDYLARNGFGNTCGGSTAYQKDGYDGPYFVASTGEDLTQEPYIGSGSIVGRYVYDKTKNFTKWQVASVQNQDATNDRLNLALVAPGPGYGPSVTISPGDECYICLECGVDGNVCVSAGDLCFSRRNDCNQHILYLGRPTQTYGMTTYRRFYFKFSSDYIKPTTGQKIAYYLGNISGQGWTAATILMNPAFNRLDISGNIGFYYQYYDYPLPIQVNTWYYIEEKYKTESDQGAGDGAYACWCAKDGEEPVQVFDLTNITMPPGTAGVSIWGNKQAYEDMAGYAYVDDVVISTTRVWPVGATPDTTPPDTPSSVQMTAP